MVLVPTLRDAVLRTAPQGEVIRLSLSGQCSSSDSSATFMSIMATVRSASGSMLIRLSGTTAVKMQGRPASPASL